MIHVHYRPGCLRLQGHAGAGAPGQDLVCSAASILCSTVAANVLELEKQGLLRWARLKLDSGEAEITWEAGEAADAAVEAVCMGFRLLAEAFPENVECKMSSGDAAG